MSTEKLPLFGDNVPGPAGLRGRERRREGPGRIGNGPPPPSRLDPARRDRDVAETRLGPVSPGSDRAAPGDWTARPWTRAPYCLTCWAAVGLGRFGSRSLILWSIL